MPREDDSYLLDMLLAARDALDFAAGLTFAQFEMSRLHQNAILKAIEIVGEAAARISVQSRLDHPDIPWQEIIGMRNRLVHGYFEVNLQRVQDTIQNDLPGLILMLESLVPPEELQVALQPLTFPESAACLSHLSIPDISPEIWSVSALMLNYTQPHGLALPAMQRETDIALTGLCHSVQARRRCWPAGAGHPQRRSPTPAPASTTWPGTSTIAGGAGTSSS